METKSPSTSRNRVPSAKRWGSSAKPITSITQPSRPVGQEAHEQAAGGLDRPKSGISPKGRPLSSNVYLKKTIAKGWKAQEVPTTELSPEELDKLVGDEVESLKEKKRALEGMLTSQGLGAGDQSLHPDWVKGEVMIPDFHCARCRDHFYGLTDEPCEEELERMKREGLWGGSEKIEGDQSPKSRKQRESSALSPKHKRAADNGLKDHENNEKSGSSKGINSSGVVSKSRGGVGGNEGVLGGTGDTLNISDGKALGGKSGRDTTGDDRNADGAESTVNKFGSSVKRNVKGEIMQDGDFHDCMQEADDARNGNRTAQGGSDNVGDTGNNMSYGSNSNATGAYLGKGNESGVGKSGKLEPEKRRRRKVRSGAGENSSGSESGSDCSGEEGSGVSGRNKKSRNRRENADSRQGGKVLDGTELDQGGGGANRDTLTGNEVGGVGQGSRLGVRKEGVNATQSVRLGADTGMEENRANEKETGGYNSNSAAQSGEFSNRVETREWDKGATRYSRKGDEETSVGEARNVGRGGVPASAGAYRQGGGEGRAGREEDLRSPSQILSSLMNTRRPKTALPSLRSELGFAVSQPYTFSYYN